MDIDTARIIARTLVVLTAIPAILSVAIHLRTPWKATPLGKHLVAFASVLAAVLSLTVLSWFFPRGNPTFLLIYMLVFMGLPVVMWWRVSLQLQAQRGVLMSSNPTDVKVPVAAGVSAFASAVVVLMLNFINKEPMDQAALEAVLSAVVIAVLTFGAGWLKKTPLNVLQARAVHHGVIAPPESNVKDVINDGR